MADSLLAQRLRQLPGVSSVEIAGAATPAIRVDVNLRALNAMGLSPDQLRNALSAANVTSPQGFLSNGATTMAVSANDPLHSGGRVRQAGDRQPRTARRCDSPTWPRSTPASRMRTRPPGSRQAARC